MPDRNNEPSLLRAREAEGSARVTSLELFFDLVFVFATTQLSHYLLGHLDLLGAVQTMLLFMGERSSGHWPCSACRCSAR